MRLLGVCLMIMLAWSAILWAQQPTRTNAEYQKQFDAAGELVKAKVKSLETRLEVIRENATGFTHQIYEMEALAREQKAANEQLTQDLSAALARIKVLENGGAPETPKP